MSDDKWVFDYGSCGTREIKFRAWNLTENRFLTTEELIYKIGVWAKSQIEGSKPDPSDEIIFQQYTGLKDKNGVEIYEGDYLWSKGSHRGFVMFEEGRFFVSVWNAKKDIHESDEVVGNIFEGVDK